MRIYPKTLIRGHFRWPVVQKRDYWPRYFSATYDGLCNSYPRMIIYRHTASFGRDSGL